MMLTSQSESFIVNLVSRGTLTTTIELALLTALKFYITITKYCETCRCATFVFRARKVFQSLESRAQTFLYKSSKEVSNLKNLGST